MGLVCSSEVYQVLVLNLNPYSRLDNPGRLQLELGITQYEIVPARDEHAEETQIFCEIIGVEQALCQQLVNAIEPKYLTAGNKN